MAKRTRKKQVLVEYVLPQTSAALEPRLQSFFRKSLSDAWLPLLLAAVTFLAYWPSLQSDFVYDARQEILNEGFITSLTNLPTVLSLKVLGMNLMLGDRPGQILYLMLVAAIWGKEPFGYHLCSNLLHAANVALLFVLFRRLIAAENVNADKRGVTKAPLAAATAALVFALHPISVEPVAGVNYSSDLLVTFFTLLALLAATSFRPESFRASLLAGGAGALCAFAAVTCKESGIAAALLLIGYWFLYRRQESRGPWLCFLGAATFATAAFLAARFLFAPPAEVPSSYLGGSIFQVFWIQPRLWVFMMGKLFWPTQFSADYTLENLSSVSTPLALVILLVMVLLQIWLAGKSRMGALGVAIYWLGLATVSNFIPLSRILGDRFYYLPLAGVAMQLLALCLMTLQSRWGFRLALTPGLVTLLPLAFLTVQRQDVFASELSFWSDTLRASPFSQRAHDGFGSVLLQTGHTDDAIAQFQKALEIDPQYALAHLNLGVALSLKGQANEAISQFQKALDIDPHAALAHNDCGFVLLQQGRADEAIIQYRKALEIEPNLVLAHFGLGRALVQKGRTEDAISEFQEAARLNPDFTAAREELAKAQDTVQQRAGPK
jgi:protein O-mannosyl-transferase